MKNSKKNTLSLLILAFIVGTGALALVISNRAQKTDTTPQQSGAASCAMRFSVGGPTATPSTPYPTPSATPNGTPRPQTSIKVSFDSITGTPSEIGARIRWGLMGDTNEIGGFIPFKRSGSEYIAISEDNFPSTPFWIAIKGEKHQQRLFNNVSIPSNRILDLKGKILSPGDVTPQDGTVDVNDINVVVSLIAKPTKTSNDIFQGDMNYDTVVNAADVSAILKTLSSKSDETIQ